MLTTEFLLDFKQKTEARWTSAPPDKGIGFQFAPGTRWLPGLSEDQILAYERDLGLTFPPEFRLYLRHLNGTDLELRHNQTGRTDVGVYSYPRDLDRVRSYMEEWRQDWPGIASIYELDFDDCCVPIYGHRGILCRKLGGTSPVFSIMGDDAVLYEEDLRAYLVREFLGYPPPPGLV